MSEFIHFSPDLNNINKYYCKKNLVGSWLLPLIPALCRGFYMLPIPTKNFKKNRANQMNSHKKENKPNLIGVSLTDSDYAVIEELARGAGKKPVHIIRDIVKEFILKTRK